METPQQPTQSPEIYDRYTTQAEKLNDLHKLLCFLLENDIGLSVGDPAQVYISQSKTEPRRGYTDQPPPLRFITNIRPHDTQPARTIITYSEVAFVFDPAPEKEGLPRGYSADDHQPLYTSTKDELAVLVAEDTARGIALPTERHFAWNLYDALTRPIADVHQRIAAAQADNTPPRQLRPRKRTIHSIARDLGVSWRTIEHATENPEVAAAIGTVAIAARRDTIHRLYTSRQAGIFADYLREQGMLGLLSPQEGELSVTGLAKQLGLHHMTVRRAITALNNVAEADDMLVGVHRKARGSRSSIHYTPREQERIIEYLRAKGYEISEDTIGQSIAS
mgnify:CR=1 FL=1